MHNAANEVGQSRGGERVWVRGDERASPLYTREAVSPREDHDAGPACSTSSYGGGCAVEDKQCPVHASEGKTAAPGVPLVSVR